MALGRKTGSAKGELIVRVHRVPGEPEGIHPLKPFVRLRDAKGLVLVVVDELESLSVQFLFQPDNRRGFPSRYVTRPEFPAANCTPCFGALPKLDYEQCQVIVLRVLSAVGLEVMSDSRTKRSCA